MAEGSINVQGKWLTAEDLQRRIKEKMDSGDMKFADLAAALEELNSAMENAHTLEVKFVLTKADYNKLRSIGGEDDNASVRKAIQECIGGEKPKAEAKPAAAVKPVAKKASKKEDTVQCSKCKTPIPIPTRARPLELECEFCGTTIILPIEEEHAETAPPAELEEKQAEPEDKEDKSEPKRTDHFIG